MKAIIAIISLLVAALLLAGCVQTPESIGATPTPGPSVTTDDGGAVPSADTALGIESVAMDEEDISFGDVV